MDSTIPVAGFSAWLSRPGVAAGYAALYIVNYAQLLHAYDDEGFPFAIEAALKERLSVYGIGNDEVLMLGDCALIRLSDEAIAQVSSDELLSGKLDQALSYEPIACGEHHVFLHLRTAWIGSVETIASGVPAAFSDLEATSRAIAYAEAERSMPEQVRSDMALASRFFRQMHEGRILLSFQPVRFTQDEQAFLYYETLLRCAGADDNEYWSCGETITALERLRLVERLDASVLWTVLRVLRQHPGVHLGCNLSALSLRRADWWEPVFAQLREAPELARRLVLEITETACIMDIDEASRMLQSLRALGCRIALDDMEAGFNTLYLAELLRPDIIKLDKTLLHAARSPDNSAYLDFLTNLLRPVCRYVVAEGVECDRDLNASLDAGVHAIQGYFVGTPSPQPSWLSATAFVDDFFKPFKPFDNALLVASYPSDY